MSNPHIEITVVPDEDAIERILRMKVLKRIRIHITRPNADDSDVESILNGLVAQGAKSQELELVAMPGKGLCLEDAVKKQARVGAYNGFVEGSGIDGDDGRVKLSTKSYPKLIKRGFLNASSSISQIITIAKEAIIGS